MTTERTNRTILREERQRKGKTEPNDILLDYYTERLKENIQSHRRILGRYLSAEDVALIVKTLWQ